MAEDGHCTSSLYALLWWDQRAPPPFNTLDDCASEGLVAGEDEVSPALPHPTQSSTTSLPHNYTGLCYEVTLGERESGWGEARSPSLQA